MRDSSSKAAQSARDRVRKHREGLRASGLRPVTRWVPDTRSPEFQAEYRRQLQAIADDPRDREMMAELEAIQSDEGWV